MLFVHHLLRNNVSLCFESYNLYNFLQNIYNNRAITLFFFIKRNHKKKKYVRFKRYENRIAIESNR